MSIVSSTLTNADYINATANAKKKAKRYSVAPAFNRTIAPEGLDNVNKILSKTGTSIVPAPIVGVSLSNLRAGYGKDMTTFVDNAGTYLNGFTVADKGRLKAAKKPKTNRTIPIVKHANISDGFSDFGMLQGTFVDPKAPAYSKIHCNVTRSLIPFVNGLSGAVGAWITRAALETTVQHGMITVLIPDFGLSSTNFIRSLAVRIIEDVLDKRVGNTAASDVIASAVNGTEDFTRYKANGVKGNLVVQFLIADATASGSALSFDSSTHPLSLSFDLIDSLVSRDNRRNELIFNMSQAAATAILDGGGIPSVILDSARLTNDYFNSMNASDNVLQSCFGGINELTLYTVNGTSVSFHAYNAFITGSITGNDAISSDVAAMTGIIFNQFLANGDFLDLDYNLFGLLLAMGGTFVPRAASSSITAAAGIYIGSVYAYQSRDPRYLCKFRAFECRFASETEKSNFLNKATEEGTIPLTSSSPSKRLYSSISSFGVCHGFLKPFGSRYKELIPSMIILDVVMSTGMYSKVPYKGAYKRLRFFY